ncbi:SGNH family hydrolase [Microvirga sp. 0TCS3.31]
MTLALLLVAGGVDAALAQSGYNQQPGYRDPRAYPPGYYPGKLVQPAQPQQQQGFSFRRFFGAQEEPPPPARAPVSRPRRSAPPPAIVAKQEKPKVDPSTHVVVFGDALAGYARQGLDAHFSDDQDIAVVSKVRSDTNLIRTDPADWPNFIKATLDSGQKASIAVVMLGTNDRQSIRDGEDSVEPLSDRWKELYRQRIDAITVALKERKVPFIWIGLPPMKNSKISDDLVAMNEIYKESVQRNGGVYVDIWPGFVDEDNRYTDIGPDVDGDPTKLRTNEGVFFTRAGARKVAFFADTEIKRVLGLGGTATAAPNPAQIAPADGSAVPTIEAAVPPPLDAAAPIALPQRPLIGPVLPLTRQDVAPGGTLVSAPPKLTGDNAYTVQRALRVGIAPSSRPGRADDFRWPNP